MFHIVLSALIAFAIVWLLGMLLIPVLRRIKPAQPERAPAPDPPQPQPKKKQQPPPKPPAPTMGGMLMLFAIAIVTLIFGLDGMEFALPAVVATLAFGVLGFVDDFMKARDIEHIGLKAYQKLLAELVIATVIAVWAYRSPLIGSGLAIPFSSLEWDIGVWYVPLMIFVILSETTAAQITDGMDGLVTSVTMVYALFMIAIFSAVAMIANQNGELLLGDNLAGSAVFAAAVAGACVGFLRYNSYPARIQLGSTGSLALGGAISLMAILSRSILLLPLMGFCFVASIGSVILQAFGRRGEDGKKPFRAAPIHRHYELNGHPPSQIVSMYAIVTAVCCAVCLLPYLQ
jgi:phospho-N-acetylmuramoyl-pentapeptide-transferase